MIPVFVQEPKKEKNVPMNTGFTCFNADVIGLCTHHKVINCGHW